MRVPVCSSAGGRRRGRRGRRRYARRSWSSSPASTGCVVFELVNGSWGASPLLLLFFLQLPMAIMADPALLPCKLHTDANDTASVPFHRSSFPPGFVFGTATAAFQVEGGANEGGRETSIWDTFSKIPGKVLDGTNGDAACDQYHKYLEDIDLMSQLNMDAYRFSIAWSRIIKSGGQAPVVNPEGVAYYNNLIDGLLKKGIQPYVTLYHWDLPQSLFDAYGGWIDRRIVDAFAQYAEACFAAFGDRVKHWMTFNEPQQFAVQGYGIGSHAPGRCSDRTMSATGDSATEPYLAGHHALLAHAAAVDVYRRKFQPSQGGVIGLAVDCEWGEPMTDSEDDKDAAERHVLFQLGWFLDPIYRGGYPDVMRKNVGDRLPVFTPDELAMLKGSVDFIGLNHYTSRFVSNGTIPENSLTSNHWRDRAIQVSVMRNGTQIGAKAASDWLYDVPWGIAKTMLWVTDRYQKPLLYITENGMDDLDNGEQPVAELLNDVNRVAFYQNYLASVLEAVKNGVDVRGYFAWSLLDNFEWAMGYTRRFGLVFVDYDNQQRRQLKESAKWYSRFLKRDTL